MEDIGRQLAAFINSDQLRALITAVCIIAITAIVARICVKGLRHLMRRDDTELPSASIIINITRALIWIIGISSMLSICFNIDVTAIIAALGVGGIAVSLGLQDTIANLFGGLQVITMKIVQPGDRIVVGTVEGIVQDISWRQTTVKSTNGDMVIIPNSTINSAVVEKVAPAAVQAIPFVVSSDGRSLDEVATQMEKVAKDALEGAYPLERDPWVLFSEITEYGIRGKIRYVLKSPDGAREANDLVVRAIAPFTRGNAVDVLEQ